MQQSRSRTLHRRRRAIRLLKWPVARAIARLLTPSRGEIVLGGVPLRRLPEGVLRRQAEYVPQEHYTFSGGLRMNLDPTDEHHTDDELLRTCRE